MTQTDIAASQDYWNRRAEAFDKQYNGLDVRQEVTRRILELAGPIQRGTILDLGIGTARLYRDNHEQFKHAEKIIGVELSPEMLIRAEAGMTECGYSQFHGINCSYTDLNVKDQSLDFAISSLSLHHVTDADKISVLTRVRNGLKDNGRLIIADQLNCTGREMSDEELQITMVRTFFPEIELEEALAKTSVHREYTCSLPRFASMISDLGFRVETERLADFVGIVSATKTS